MKSIIFNIDCLLNFLNIERSDLLEFEFKSIIISKKVFNNLQNPSIPKYIRDDLDLLIEKKFIKIAEINLNTDAFEIYYEIVNNGNKEIISEGVAASIALAVKYNSPLALNNPDFVKDYLDKYEIEYITTEDIIEDLLNKKLISKSESNEIINQIKK